MATNTDDVDLTGLKDPQRPVAFAVGLVLIVVGLAGTSGIIDSDVGLGPGLVFGLFGVPLWLGITAIVAGIIGIWLSLFPGAGTTFNKVAAGLVLPAVFLLSIVDWAIAAGGVLYAVGAVALLLAVLLVVVGVVLLYGLKLSLVLPVVAVLALADWAVGLSAMAPASEPVNLPTLALLVALELVVGVLAFEGGRRRT